MASRGKEPRSFELVNTNNRPPVSPPRVLDHILNESLDNCSQLLEHLFVATDDLFYDLSKRASSNNEENLYFDSMRELRIQKQGVISNFLHDTSDAFNTLIQNPNSRPDADIAAEASKLALVERDELEIRLAQENMTARTRQSYMEELYELDVRLDHLLLQVSVDQNNNPLDPQQISQFFVAACAKQLKIDIKARLIFFKLFEKHVLKQLGHIYAKANTVLIEAGILPKVPRNLHGHPSKGQYRAAKPEEPEKLTSPPNIEAKERAHLLMQKLPKPTNIDLSALNQLMATARKTLTNKFVPDTGTVGSAYGHYSDNPGPTMSAPELTTLLTKKQALADRLLVATEPSNIISEIVKQLLTKQNSEIPQSLAQCDENIINLVAMFFDQLLAENLPLTVQSLLCRLQIPTLKVAIHDHSFLTNPQHPTRRLLNCIAHVGLGFDESKTLESDPLYRIIVDGVQNINRQYKFDINVFVEVQKTIDAFIENENKKTKIVQQRTTQTESGKSKVKRARYRSETALYEKMKKTALTDEVSTFLTNTWLPVLVITLLKHGENSPDWIEMEQLISDLIWLCLPKNDDRSRKRKQTLQPEILQRIQKGLEAGIDNPDTLAAKLGLIRNSLETNNARDTEYRYLNDEQIKLLGKSANGTPSWDDMTAVERQQSQFERLSEKHYSLAKNLPEGTWLEYFDEESGKTFRCKLAAKIDSDTYIFVNRFGLKVLENSRRQFAYDMQFKKVHVFNSSPMFERLMDKLVNGLTQVA